VTKNEWWNFMKCKCGFMFSGAGEFRNCEAFITDDGQSGIICPKCGTAYVHGYEVRLKVIPKDD